MQQQHSVWFINSPVDDVDSIQGVNGFQMAVVCGS